MASDKDSRANDPLGQQWVNAHLNRANLLPTEIDRQDKLYSLITHGRGPEGGWTDEDWAFYKVNREALWGGRTVWPGEDLPEGYDRFQLHLQRLAGYYGFELDRRVNFTRAAGLIWGGIEYQGSAFKALARASVGHHHSQLHEGFAGWQARYVDDANPAHHWIAAFLAGFFYGKILGATINTVRDVAQYVTGQGGTRGDIYLGNIAAYHGDMLSKLRADSTRPYDALFSSMRQDLSIQD